MAQLVKNLPAMRETWVQSLGWEDPLEKGKATHSSILAWRIPWTDSLWGSKAELDATEQLSLHLSLRTWTSLNPLYSHWQLHFITVTGPHHLCKSLYFSKCKQVGRNVFKALSFYKVISALTLGPCIAGRYYMQILYFSLRN